MLYDVILIGWTVVYCTLKNVQRVNQLMVGSSTTAREDEKRLNIVGCKIIGLRHVLLSLMARSSTGFEESRENGELGSPALWLRKTMGILPLL